MSNEFVLLKSFKRFELLCHLFDILSLKYKWYNFKRIRFMRDLENNCSLRKYIDWFMI